VGTALLPIAGAATAHAPADAVGGQTISARATLAQTIAARRHFFGAANVDARTGAVRPDRAIFSWFGVTNFAVALRGHVVLFDAWIPRGAHRALVPTSPEELAALAPERIFIGHAHFDHAADAVPIAEATGAPLVGLSEQCDELQKRSSAPMPPRCIRVLPPGAPLGSRADIHVLDGVAITVVRHLHSGTRSPDGRDAAGYHVPVTPFPTTALLEHPPTPADVAQLVQHAPDAEGGSVLYRFRVGGMTFVWHDTAGPLKETAPRTYDVLRSLRPVDVELGAIQGFNQITNGLRDPRMYMEALAPRIFVPTHHDDWLTGITSRGETHRTPLEDEMAKIPASRRPSLYFISDPLDYLRPAALTYRLRFPSPRLTRHCLAGARLRAALAGELVMVRRVRFVLGRERPLTATRRPFAATFSAAAVRRSRGVSLRAIATLSDGTTKHLRRGVPSC
jgi:L-ascorbate metabolism protein UlaG (beta-lactamase superfamily)